MSFSFLSGPYGQLATLSINFHDKNPARIIFAHGYNASATMVEHAKLFPETTDKLAAQLDIGALLFDFTGHGLSEGYFRDMSPNRRIDELTFLIDRVRQDYDGPLFLLGFSMGGAVSIHAAAKREALLAGLITWSCVPSFDPASPSAHWYPAATDADNAESPGPAFYSERPVQSIAETYKSLSLPKLQVQGDADFTHFADEFKEFFDEAKEPKKLVILPGGDHVFMPRHSREAVIAETSSWLKEQLA